MNCTTEGLSGLYRSRSENDQPVAVVVAVDAGLEALAGRLADLGSSVSAPHLMPVVNGGPGVLQVGAFTPALDFTAFTFDANGPPAHELVAYFAARHTSIDCYEKHGRKGHVVIVTATSPRPFVDPDQVYDVIGDKLRQAIPAADILVELKERYEVHVIVPGWMSGSTKAVNSWVKVLGGGAVVSLTDPDAICSVISTLVAS